MLLSLLLSLLLSQFLNLLLSLFAVEGARQRAAVMPSSWQQLAVGDAVQRQGVQGGAKTGQIVEIEYTVRYLNMDTETFLGSEDADMARLHSLADTWTKTCRVAEVQKTKKATAARDQKTQKAKKAKEAQTGGKPVKTKINKTETKTKTKIILEKPVTMTYKKKVYTCCTSVPVLGERVAGACRQMIKQIHDI